MDRLILSCVKVQGLGTTLLLHSNRYRILAHKQTRLPRVQEPVMAKRYVPAMVMRLPDPAIPAQGTSDARLRTQTDRQMHGFKVVQAGQLIGDIK